MICIDKISKVKRRHASMKFDYENLTFTQERQRRSDNCMKHIALIKVNYISNPDKIEAHVRFY